MMVSQGCNQQIYSNLVTVCISSSSPTDQLSAYPLTIQIIGQGCSNGMNINALCFKPSVEIDRDGAFTRYSKTTNNFKRIEFTNIISKLF